MGVSPLTQVAPVHRDLESLERGLPDVIDSPRDRGTLDLVVCRPGLYQREILDVAELSLTDGVVGDSWKWRGSKRTADGSPHPDMQLNIINSRLSRLVAGDDDDHRALAGDQLHIDLDLSETNLPAGTRLAIGTAAVEVTDQPHRGCPKFAARFGSSALRFVSGGTGKEMRLRGINAKVVQRGLVRAGDPVVKVPT